MSDKELAKKILELVCVLKSIALEKDSIVNCDETWCKVRKYDHYKKCYNIARTKEEEEKKSSQTVPVPKMLVNKHNEMKLEKER